MDPFFVQNDLPAAAAGALAAMACAIVGSFLVLRRMSLMGDAISHAVLPGIVAAFVFADSLSTWPVFVGCAFVGVVTALLSELVHRLGRVEPGASMGVVFTVLFALGVVWLSQIEHTGAGQVHIDADCVLHGALEGVYWPTAPETVGGLFTAAPWETFPRQLTILALVLLANIAFVALLFKELRITSFDPALAVSQGIRPAVVHYLLMTFVAMTTVAAFEAVGSILVVAMLIVPGLIAHLLTDRLAWLIPLSMLAALFASVGGYAAAVQLEVSSAGMMGVCLGVLLAVTGLFAPKHGWISRMVRRFSIAVTILREDMLGLLYRVGELSESGEAALELSEARKAVGGGFLARVAAWSLRRRGDAMVMRGELRLTPRGAARATDLVRSHRLWESYLVHKLGLRPDHVHGTATRLEHLTTPAMQQELEEGISEADLDPHGRTIPAPPERTKKPRP